ncbi:MAG: flagellar basal body rod protein FlgB [Lachnospiraceae bacterium]|nr:flagellar basal body rod protein FlgB [Lachnospiraceae bacterium]
MINTNVFDYVNVLDKAADASWLRNEAISNNLANSTTPLYKRQDVSFEDTLRQSIMGADGTNLDSKISEINLQRLRPTVYTDSAASSYRLDGNNVDVDTENVYLAQNQIKYQGLIDCINQEFTNLQNAMK